ncbi:hypothetical protein [Chryseobacterium mulctrae]|uniref:hypothetical protein n=1 Tax=Chryseobacterium mulctrae TaxID=2576777 RepID=UPI001117A98A|nr:hypothetical protein [Chryseobacterium mulctrae]
MNLNIDKIKLAYNKLKTYVYYDNTELFLREKLVEFETDTVKSNFNLNWEVSKLYTADETKSIFDIFTHEDKSIEENLDIKFTKLLNELNNFNDKSDYFKHLFNSITVNYFPKKYIILNKMKILLLIKNNQIRIN